jgi:5-oxoprolinase (ATP-hydrolysing) subunit A
VVGRPADRGVAAQVAQADTEPMARSIDLNADLGEECGDDDAMLRLVTTANVACGAHAGGGQTMRATIDAAKTHGVAIGVHPSYPDRPGFGRTSMLSAVGEGHILGSLVEQIEQFLSVAGDLGVAASHVKPHGALYNDAMVHESAARLLLGALRQTSAAHSLPLMGMPGSVLERLATAEGHAYITEGFADRAYEPDGTLMPRSHDGAVLSEEQAVIQASALANGSVVAVDGTVLHMRIDSLCVHGDTPDAVSMARRIREELTADGFDIRAVGRR